MICWVDLHGRGERLLTERDAACFCASGDRVISTQLCACSYQLFRTWLPLHRNSRKKNGYCSFNSFTFALPCLLGPHDVWGWMTTYYGHPTFFLVCLIFLGLVYLKLPHLHLVTCNEQNPIWAWLGSTQYQQSGEASGRDRPDWWYWCYKEQHKPEPLCTSSSFASFRRLSVWPYRQNQTDMDPQDTQKIAIKMIKLKPCP